MSTLALHDGPFQIEHSEPVDAEAVFGLFDQSIIYQEQKGYPVWKNYDKDTLINDINNKNHYKIIIDSRIAMVFSVCYTDRILWREMEKGDAIYLHRIVVSPSFKGQRLFGLILAWAVPHAKSKKLRFVRMDTWANDQNIIEYYKTFGFRFIENYTTPDTNALPKHNRNLPLALLEIELE